MRLCTSPVVLLGALALAGACRTAPKRVPTLLVCEHIWLDARASAPVEAVLVDERGCVAWSGTRAAWDVWYAGRRGQLAGLEIRELGGVAVPGLADAHGHVESLGETLESVDLVGVASEAELVARVAARASGLPAGAWITGRGWDQTLWEGARFPTHAALSEALSDQPVFLERVDGHAALVNARALELARLSGVLGERAAIPGGRVELDAAGRAAGVLVDAACDQVAACIPRPDQATRERRILAAQAELLRVGLTCVHDMGAGLATLRAFVALDRRGELDLRVVVYVSAHEGLSDELVAEIERVNRRASERLRVIGVKLVLDGAMGSRGAALLADYSDAPGERGLLLLEPETFRARVEQAAGLGLQPATHAIGDRANRIALDVYGDVLAARPDFAALAPRIEHAQAVAPEDWPRFEALGVLASMQPTHATSDMRWAEARLGDERVRGAYAWRKLARDPGDLAFGSDFPVENPDPRLGLWAARTRCDPSGAPAGGWRAEECLSAREALAAFTRGAARALRAEGELGSLHAGARADLTVFDVDLLAEDAHVLLGARVLATIVGGEVVVGGVAGR
jgi:predicted amidohydrolase YtcJ